MMLKKNGLEIEEHPELEEERRRLGGLSLTEASVNTKAEKAEKAEKDKKSKKEKPPKLQSIGENRNSESRDNAGSSSAPRSRTNSLAPSPWDTYTFFAKYTYSSECALLGYNFHTIVTQLGIFEFISYPHDYRLISVTLAYIFYKYKIHHCDMALDLALTLIYLEELNVPTLLGFVDNDAFNVVCYFAFLAHVYNADRTIRLTDWYKEMNRAGAPRSFKNCKEANKFVYYLFHDVRKLRLMPNEQRVKKYIQRLCSAPQLHPPR